MINSKDKYITGAGKSIFKCKQCDHWGEHRYYGFKPREKDPHSYSNHGHSKCRILGLHDIMTSYFISKS